MCHFTRRRKSSCFSGFCNYKPFILYKIQCWIGNAVQDAKSDVEKYMFTFTYELNN